MPAPPNMPIAALPIGTYVCMCACMYVCVYVCMYVCMHACMHAQPILIPPFNTAMRARKHTRKRVHTRACAHMRKRRRERVRSHALASCRDPAYANALVYTEVYMTDSQEKGLSLSFFLSLSLSLARSLARPPARSLCMCCARAPSFPPLLSPSPSSPTSLSQSRALSEHTARLFSFPHATPALSGTSSLARTHSLHTRLSRACLRARTHAHKTTADANGRASYPSSFFEVHHWNLLSAPHRSLFLSPPLCLSRTARCLSSSLPSVLLLLPTSPLALFLLPPPSLTIHPLPLCVSLSINPATLHTRTHTNTQRADTRTDMAGRTGGC